jgi:hypothetical protein
MINVHVCGRRRPSSQPVEEMTSSRCSRLAVVTVSIAMQAVVATIGASPAFAN